MPTILIPEQIDQELERLCPPELQGRKKTTLRIIHAARSFIENAGGAEAQRNGGRVSRRRSTNQQRGRQTVPDTE